MLSFLKPAPHIARLPDDQIDSTYKRLRWQIFFGIFFGYAAYYPMPTNLRHGTTKLKFKPVLFKDGL